MAIIATVSFSKKIPVPDSEYSSQGYSLSLQTEIPESDPAAIRSRLHDTFQLVKDQVEHELANGNTRKPEPEPQQTSTAPAGRTNGRASNKQIKFVTDLATRQGLGLNALNARIRERFGVDGLYDLDRRQASQVVDELKAKAA